MRLLRWLDDHAYAIQGWTLGILFAFMIAVLIFGPHVGLASEDMSPPQCHGLASSSRSRERIVPQIPDDC